MVMIRDGKHFHKFVLRLLRRFETIFSVLERAIIFSSAMEWLKPIIGGAKETVVKTGGDGDLEEGMDDSMLALFFSLPPFPS